MYGENNEKDMRTLEAANHIRYALKHLTESVKVLGDTAIDLQQFNIMLVELYKGVLSQQFDLTTLSVGIDGLMHLTNPDYEPVTLSIARSMLAEIKKVKGVS